MVKGMHVLSNADNPDIESCYILESYRQSWKEGESYSDIWWKGCMCYARLITLI